MYNDNVATSKDSEAYVAGQSLFYGKPNPQAAKVTASQQSNQPIQHWLFHSQTSIISDINSDINFVAKGVDINDPLLPVSLPRGYGGVTILWKKTH